MEVMAANVVSITPCKLDNYLSVPDRTLDAHLAEVRRELGERVLILGHHYQRDEVIRFCDYRGDSLQLARQGQRHPAAEFIVFCGVHFMAESADILRAAHQQVILPDLNAGCSMADMAEDTQVEALWEQLERLGLAASTLPLTYMNSTAAIKAFCGARGGLVCTSSNAAAAFRWAFARQPRLVFLPDQHLGRNTGFAMGIPLEEMVVWDPQQSCGGLTAEELTRARVILWKGHCSVHQRFRPEDVDRKRAAAAQVTVIVHPECSFEVVQKADLVGSTEFIIRQIAAAPPGSVWAVGTELHLVHRLAQEFPDRHITPLDGSSCPVCSTMFRISPQHLAWVLDNLQAGTVVNRITVPSPVKHWARVALDRMLEVG